MADSDDDYDSRERERDKFRRERNDLNDRQRSRDGRGSGSSSSYDKRRNDSSSWDSRRNRKRSFDYRDYDRGHGRSNRGSSPPSKRNRDWEQGVDHFYRDESERRLPPLHHQHQPAYEYMPNYVNDFHQFNSRPDTYGGNVSSTGSAASMMTFKQFLNSLSDEIDEEDAIKKYNEYKLDYKRTHCKKFFMIHKGEDWFRQKYHPVDSSAKTEYLKDNVVKRLLTFMEMYDNDRLSDVPLHHDNTMNVTRILDEFVIRLEGGTDDDAELLDNEVRETDVPDKPKLQTEATEIEETGNGNYESDSENKEDAAKDETESRDSKRGEDDEGYIEEGDDENDSKRSENLDMSKNSNSNEIGDVKRRKFHKNLSIFLRNLAPVISKTDIESVVSQYEGFIRVAVGEVMPDKRHAWATFESTVDIRETCNKINGSKIRKFELYATLNRELNRRIRSIAGYAAHKPCVENDIMLASKLAKFLDNKYSLWISEKKHPELLALNYETNPILEKIDKLSLPESEELQEDEDSNTEYDVDVNKDLLQVLDRLLLYLRLVHSVDYYGGSEYIYEDDMPHRCGILTVRGKSAPKIQYKEIKYWKDSMAKKTSPRFQEPPARLTDKECEHFVTNKFLNHIATEVEAFIKENTKELSSEKWLCPLSGKKFRGPEFVKKHIFNKHSDKVDEVRAEVEFFHNFLRDPNRPEEVEPSLNRRSGTGNARGPPPPPLGWPRPMNWGPPVQPPLMMND
ncbi:uncharacterized protein TRIADDRAFT_64154, partial [Trichoplax adhaerens]